MGAKSDKIIEEIRAIETRGFDDCHQDVADPRTGLGFIVYRVFPAQNALFQKSFDLGIGERSTFDA